MASFLQKEKTWKSFEKEILSFKPRTAAGIITEKGVATAPYEESIPKLFDN